MRKTKSGFTIIELLVIIVVIGILATVSVISFSGVQRNARDKQRATNMTSLAEALETYYDKNGEYPGCSDITQSPTVVSSTVLVGMKPSILTSPLSPFGTNSILPACADLSGSNTSQYAYLGDGSAACVTGHSCTNFYLKYTNEATGKEVIIKSRRSSGVIEPDIPSFTVALVGADVTATITATSCPAGTTQYTFASRTNDGDWSPFSTWGVALTSSQPANDGVKYGYKIKARCFIDASTFSIEVISPEVTYADPMETPIVTCGSATTTTMTCSWDAITGAASYNYQTRINGGSWSSTLSSSSTSQTVATTSQGSLFEIQVRAVGVSGNYNNWSTVTGTTLSISGPTWTSWGRSEAYPSWQSWVYNSSGASICPSGTSIYTQFRDGIYNSYWNAWGSFGSNGTSSSTLKYSSTISNFSSTLQTQIQGYCKNESTGAVSTTVATGVSTAIHTAPNVVYAGPVECAGTYSLRPFQLRLWIQEVSHNLEANTSNVNWYLYRYSVSGYPSFDYTHTWLWTVTVHGTGWAGYSDSRVFQYNAYVGATEGIVSGSLTIAHDVNGYANIGYSSTDGTYNPSTIFGVASNSCSVVLSDLRI